MGDPQTPREQTYKFYFDSCIEYITKYNGTVTGTPSKISELINLRLIWDKNTPHTYAGGGNKLNFNFQAPNPSDFTAFDKDPKGANQMI